jgi:hypothetical protein
LARLGLQPIDDFGGQNGDVQRRSVHAAG